MIKGICISCGNKHVELHKIWLYKNHWEWWCEECIDADEDGYVIELPWS